MRREIFRRSFLKKKRLHVIDTIEEIETPEGVSLSLKLAGLPVRTMAFIIDLLIRIAIFIALGLIAAFIGKVGVTIFLVGSFLTEWFYPVMFEVYRNGQTPGKKKMGLMVLNDDGTPVSLQASIIRNFLRSADFLPGFYLTGMLCMFFDKKMRRAGDLAAGTVVAYVEKPNRRRVKNKLKAEMIPAELTSEEKQAIISFAERSAMISQPRKEELAAIIRPIHNLKNERAVDKIYQYANGLLGDK